MDRLGWERKVLMTAKSHISSGHKRDETCYTSPKIRSIKEILIQNVNTT